MCIRLLQCFQNISVVERPLGRSNSLVNTTEDHDEDVNLLLEMAAEAEAAGDPPVVPLIPRTSNGATEAKLSAAAPGPLCTKRKAPTSPCTADGLKKARQTETFRSLVLDTAETVSQAEHFDSKAPSAAFQPVSGRHARAPPQHIGKPLTGEKAVEKHSGLKVSPSPRSVDHMQNCATNCCFQ